MSALGRWADAVDPALGRKPELGPDVATRLQWVRHTCRAAGYAEGAGLRGQAREEAAAFLDALLRDGSLLCFVPVAAPPPPPGGAADVEYRARTFDLQGPSCVAGLPQIVVPAGSCAATDLPVAVTFLAARGHDRRLLALADTVAQAVGGRSW